LFALSDNAAYIRLHGDLVHRQRDEETTMIRETFYEVCNALAALSVVAFVFVMCIALN
jgi:hypothetical protein